MVRIFQSTISVAKYATLVLLGVGLFISLIFLVIFVVFPCHLYRWFVLKICARLFGPSDLRKGTNSLGNGLAGEFRKGGDVNFSRFSIVVNITIAGHLTYQEMYDRVEERWIRARNDDGQLRYPEFQQYLSSWMGFMFLKQNPDFRIEDHIKLHVLEENGDDEASERFYSDLVGKLLNDKWKAGKSPWEVHLVHNYKRSSLIENKADIQNDNDNDGVVHRNDDDKFTLLLFRFHHGLADGFGILFTLVRLVGDLDSDAIPKPALFTQKRTFWNTIIYYSILPIKVLHAMGFLVTLVTRKKTAFHCPANRKKDRQLFVKGSVIPVKTIKKIKNHFGVGFSTVLDSALAGALGRMLEQKMGTNMPDTLTYGIAIPVPGHPQVLRNHASMVIYDVPLSPEMSAVDRLYACEKNLTEVKIFPFLILISWVLRSVSGVPTNLALALAINRYISCGVSSFPGGLGQLWWDDMKIPAGDFVANTGSGVGGLGFYALSFVDKMQVNASAETAVLSKEELEQIFRWVDEQIEILYRLALEKEMNGNLNNKITEIAMDKM